MSFTCNGCGKQVDNPEVFIPENMWEIFKYATGSDNLLCTECTIKLCEYIFGFNTENESIFKLYHSNV